MKILLTGKNGLLGRDCLTVFQDKHEVLALDHRELDITDPARVEEAVSRFRPEVIVNCAAFTQVDRCEAEREAAFQGNVAGPRNLAVSAARHGALLVHISTDYVFDGKKPVPAPYLESDFTGPLSWYGRTKLEGELAIQDISNRHVIVRTAWLYGWHGPNFLKKILKLALSPRIPELKVVNDQFGSPTWSFRLAHQVARLLEAGGQGIYHASAEGYCTWFELTRHFLARLGVTKTVRPCATRDYPTPALRPQNSILENRRLKQEGLNVMRPWQEDVDEFVAAFAAALLDEAR
jgi:dTDP-4-dehydrorhamnose reductase|uniref:dTDP-4-dehydrorhamnose reductase n=1 Tax=Desulfobacca acetoxidans TaxID=60893 RepID=A0A7V6A517_9BACT